MYCIIYMYVVTKRPSGTQYVTGVHPLGVTDQVFLRNTSGCLGFPCTHLSIGSRVTPGILKSHQSCVPWGRLVGNHRAVRKVCAFRRNLNNPPNSSIDVCYEKGISHVTKHPSGTH